MAPNLEIERFGNRWRRTAMDALAVCAVAPSCWNRKSLISTPLLCNSGMKKVFTI
ncbi:unnamed protein product [Callosobruchus maculatus]|uniref:Uncharacterized protein n=1 Tax=Callosobruchus maculatus TaxID=64391 RepID=A0A653CKA4_CALMS|nr:unnamed protein product [Callosobruchus maculatus]